MVRLNEANPRKLPKEEGIELISQLDTLVNSLTRINEDLWNYDGKGFMNSKEERELRVWALQDRLLIRYDAGKGVLYRIAVDMDLAEQYDK